MSANPPTHPTRKPFLHPSSYSSIPPFLYLNPPPFCQPSPPAHPSSSVASPRLFIPPFLLRRGLFLFLLTSLSSPISCPPSKPFLSVAHQHRLRSGGSGRDLRRGEDGEIRKKKKNQINCEDAGLMLGMKNRKK